LLADLGIVLPVILAPMGGAGTPELAAAVSNAGGLGSLAAAYLAPDEIAEDIRRIRALTDKPFNINLFAGGYGETLPVYPGPMLELLGEIHTSLGLSLPALPQAADDPFNDQLEVILAAQPAVFSFTFGIPDKDAMGRIKARGIRILGTATTVEEAVLLQAGGVDGVVAQGAEAGAHRGTFAVPFEQGMIPALELVRSIRNAVSVPVIASGGLMDGHDIARAIEAGAIAAQLGTAFLPCPESGAAEVWKKAILEARSDTTVVTRAFSGRPARGLANSFTQTLQGREAMILPFPAQNALTRSMRAAAAKLGRPEFLSLWAGQGVARARQLPAHELVNQLAQELQFSVRELKSNLNVR
jgi:nitronate monooxygenase